MNINDLVTHYVAFRRTLGERCNTTEKILRSFCRAVGLQTPVSRIQTEAVAKFLAGTGPITRTWHIKYRALEGLLPSSRSAAGIWTRSRCRRNGPSAPAPSSRTSTRAKTSVACWTRSRRTGASQPDRTAHAAGDPVAAVRGRAARRRGAEADRRGRGPAEVPCSPSATPSSSKSRLVPIGRDLTKVLSDYARWRAATHPSAGGESRFFLGRDGTAIHRWTLEDAFERLREHAGVRRSDGARYQPRLHDLRHTFAVHRLTAWYRQGADVQRLVHHLSVYLGHARLAHTQVYLTMTPELLQQAGTRFERYARGEDEPCVTPPCSGPGSAGS